MKKGLLIILLSFLCFSFNPLYSQEQCKVLKQEIADKYSGKCKKGLAHGKGIAEGIDKYEGRFKNGLPDGFGKYTWSTGVVYEGFWSEGKRDGEGKLFFNMNGVDSIRVGIWKKDNFFRKINPNPYSVIRSTSVTRYSIRRIGDGNRVMLGIYQNGTINNSVYMQFFYSTSGSVYVLGPKQGFENVTFPVTLKINYSSSNTLKTARIVTEFEAIITEPGDWEIELNN